MWCCCAQESAEADAYFFFFAGFGAGFADLTGFTGAAAFTGLADFATGGAAFADLASGLAFFSDECGAGLADATNAAGFAVPDPNRVGEYGWAAALAAASAFAAAARSAATLLAVARAFSAGDRLSCAASASRINFSPSSGVICPRRTMYCTRSRALSIAKPAIPAAALITSFMADDTLVPASWLIT